MDYLKVIWDRRWLILLGTLAGVVIGFALCFLLPRKYEVDILVQPGNYFVENTSGNIARIVVENPQQVADKVTHMAYDVQLADRLKISRTSLPHLRSEVIRDTLLARIWVRDSDAELSKRMLDELFTLLKQDMDKKIAVEIDNIDAEIIGKEIDKRYRNRQIEILNQKLKIIAGRKAAIQREIKGNREKVTSLEQDQRTILKQGGRSELESLGLLLYSNEIQQSFQYIDNLDEKLSEQRIEEENVHSGIEAELAGIRLLDAEIDNLKQRKGRIDFTMLVKPPTASPAPVSPSRKLVLMIAAVLAFVMFTVIAFFLDYLKRQDMS